MSLASLVVLTPASVRMMYPNGKIGGVYAFLLSAPAVGSALLSTKLVGGLYDAEEKSQCKLTSVINTTLSDECECLGDACYGTSFLIISMLNLLAGIFGLTIISRLQKIAEEAQQSSIIPNGNHDDNDDQVIGVE